VAVCRNLFIVWIFQLSCENVYASDGVFNGACNIQPGTIHALRKDRVTFWSAYFVFESEQHIGWLMQFIQCCRDRLT
jgi:hypothetical protein